jgi:hypothetical protein
MSWCSSPRRAPCADQAVPARPAAAAGQPLPRRPQGVWSRGRHGFESLRAIQVDLAPSHTPVPEVHRCAVSPVKTDAARTSARHDPHEHNNPVPGIEKALRLKPPYVPDLPGRDDPAPQPSRPRALGVSVRNAHLEPLIETLPESAHEGATLRFSQLFEQPVRAVDKLDVLPRHRPPTIPRLRRGAGLNARDSGQRPPNGPVQRGGERACCRGDGESGGGPLCYRA